MARVFDRFGVNERSLTARSILVYTSEMSEARDRRPDV